MGIFSRFKRVLKAKISKGLDRLEDPAEQLDYAYEELLGEQKKIEKAIRDVTADKNVIEANLNEHKEAAEEAYNRAKQYRRNALKLEDQLGSLEPDGEQSAREKVKQYNESARKALGEKRKHELKVQELKKKVSNSRRWIESIREKRLDVKAKLDQVQMEKERLKSEWRMAKAESRIESALSGLGSDVGDIDLTISRAKEKIKRKRALASASREMVEEGMAEPLEGKQISPELEAEELDGLIEEGFHELDLEIKQGENRGPFFVVSVSGGGTWALTNDSAEESFQGEVERQDREISELYETGELNEEQFDQLYSKIFSRLRKQGWLVGRDITMEEVAGENEIIPQPDMKLPPEDLDFDEAQKVLQGKDLLSEWGKKAEA